MFYSTIYELAHVFFKKTIARIYHRFGKQGVKKAPYAMFVHV